MQRRNLLKMGVALCVLPSINPIKSLTITRPNFGVVHLYEDEALQNTNELKKIFQHIDCQSTTTCIRMESIVETKKFVWANWFAGRYLHLFLMGYDNYRFNTTAPAMYAGGGLGGELVKFEFANGLTHYGKCTQYWQTEIENRPAKRFRYLLTKK